MDEDQKAKPDQVECVIFLPGNVQILRIARSDCKKWTESFLQARKENGIMPVGSEIEPGGIFACSVCAWHFREIQGPDLKAKYMQAQIDFMAWQRRDLGRGEDWKDS